LSVTHYNNELGEVVEYDVYEMSDPQCLAEMTPLDIILINNKITVKAAFNSDKCIFLLNLVKIPRSPKSAFPHFVYSTNTTLTLISQVGWTAR